MTGYTYGIKGYECCRWRCRVGLTVRESGVVQHGVLCFQEKASAVLLQHSEVCESTSAAGVPVPYHTGLYPSFTILTSPFTPLTLHLPL